MSAVARDLLLAAADAAPRVDQYPVASGVLESGEAMGVYRSFPQDDVLRVKLMGTDRYGRSAVTVALVRDQPDAAAEMALRACRKAMAALD